MKSTEITMQLVKNVGNYETVRLQSTYSLTENDDLIQAFVKAKSDLEQAFKEAFKNDITTKTPKKNKEILEIGGSEFIRVCKALKDEKTDIRQVQEHYILSDAALNYLFENKLL